MSEHINVSPNLESAMPFTQEWYGDQADDVISAADEHIMDYYRTRVHGDEYNEEGLEEAMERNELAKLKKKYERVAEKEDC